MYNESSRTSFEFYPPRTEAGRPALLESVRRVSAFLNPALITMTFGASGSATGRTPELLADMATVTDVRLASHLAYLRLTKSEITAYLDRVWAMGVRHIIALRGDEPEGFVPLSGNGHYKTTADFVRAVKARHDFDVSVAAYPEKHPLSPDIETDMRFFKDKCDAGADRAFTQLFFNNNAFYDFRERAAKAGINCPIIPGLAPVKNFDGMVKFAHKLQAEIPPSLSAAFNLVARDDHADVAAEVLSRQICDLRENGVENFHFYSLNTTQIIERACRNTGLLKP